jgi:hypothetical protein
MLKKLHFKSLLLMAAMVFGGTSMWGQSDYSTTYTSNVTLSATGGTSATECTVVIGDTQYDGIKAGTGKVAGAVKITAPAGSKYLHLHLAGWSGKTVKVGVTPTTNVTPTSINLNSDDGVSSNSPFTLKGTASDFYQVITFTTPLADNTTLTLTATSGYRFIVFGVNSEEESTDPEITASDVDLAYNATSGEIPYTITNPSGATLTAAKTTGDWISNVTVDGANNKVTFDATVNTGAERNGTITLSYTGADDKVVTVTQAAAPVAVTGITLDQTTANVEAGGTVTLTPTITPAEATNKNVTWESDDTDVATVSNGVVTGVAAGTATITATTEDGDFTASCVVTVIAPDEVFVFSTMGYSNAEDITDVDGTNVNLVFDQAGNGSNAPKYYNTGTGARMYADNTLTITSTKVISKIVFTYSGSGYMAGFDVDEGDYSEADAVGTWTGAASEIVFTAAQTCRIQKIAVFFKNEEIPVSAAGFATFCSPFALDFTGVSTIEAYTAAINGSNVEFTKVTGSVPANTGLLVKAAAGTYEVPAVAASTTDVSGNKLVGTVAGTTIDGTDAGTDYYVLKQNAEGVGFYKVTNAAYSVRANSAYLAVAKGSAKGFIPVDGTTAIELVDTANEVAAPAYNLQGQRVSEGYKGVVIVNGKKIIK